MTPIGLADAKKDCSRGLLASAWIEKNPMSDTWSVFFKSKFDLSVLALAAARDNSIREFKSLDSAVSAIISVGFRVDRLSTS